MWLQFLVNNSITSDHVINNSITEIVISGQGSHLSVNSLFNLFYHFHWIAMGLEWILHHCGTSLSLILLLFTQSCLIYSTILVMQSCHVSVFYTVHVFFFSLVHVKRGIFLGINKNPICPTNAWLYWLGLPQTHKLSYKSSQFVCTNLHGHVA